MKAFVMWGAGSLGAAQVGMLRALTAHGIQPDLVVGASAGALNATFYAARPTADGVEDLAALWLSVGRHDIYPLNPAQMLRALAQDLPWHPVRGALHALGTRNYTFPVNPLILQAIATGHRNHVFDNDRLADLLTRVLPVERLEDTTIPLAVLAADARNGDPVLLCRGPAVPALLASTAIPGIYPTVDIDGRPLMDGEVATTTTLDAAVDYGADEIYLLNPGFNCHLPAPPSTVIAMLLHTYNLLADQRMAAAIARANHRVQLHPLAPTCPAEVLPLDFRQTAELITRAAEETTRTLDGHHPPPTTQPLGQHHTTASKGTLRNQHHAP
jgi:NTE family protein